jgi:hypothetical protein
MNIQRSAEIGGALFYSSYIDQPWSLKHRRGVTEDAVVNLLCSAAMGGPRFDQKFPLFCGIRAPHNVADFQCRMPPADREYLSVRTRNKGRYEA